MIEVLLIRVMNEVIPFLLLIGIGFVLYRGLKRNQTLLSEREELLKRYLLFRGDRQVRLKIYGGDEKIYLDLLKNISSSWKNFKKVYDQCLNSLAQNTTKTKHFLQLITLLLLMNTVRLFIEDYYFFGLEIHFFYTLVKRTLKLCSGGPQFLFVEKPDPEIPYFERGCNEDGSGDSFLPEQYGEPGRT